MKINTSKKERKASMRSNSKRLEEKQMFNILDNFVEMNDWRSITEQLEPGESLQPTYHLLFLGLAAAYESKGDSESAINLIHESLKYNTECPNCRWLLGCIMFRQGNSQEAINIWTGIIEQGEAYLMSNPCKACCDDMEVADVVMPVIADTYFMLSQSYAMTGDITRARSFRDLFADDLRRGSKSRYKLADLDDKIVW